MMKASDVIYLLSFIFGGIVSWQINVVVFQEERREGYNSGYHVGYKNAKIIYECDHDRAECEIIKDTL